jgi:hypothetical protein
MRRQIRLISSDVWRANRDACGGLCNCGSALSAAFCYLLDDPTEEDPPPVSGGDSTRSSGAVSISVYEVVVQFEVPLIVSWKDSSPLPECVKTRRNPSSLLGASG